ncbi:MAG: hypothetical protein AAF763_01140 [Pseudomonadota bacterium]
MRHHLWIAVAAAVLAAPAVAEDLSETVAMDDVPPAAVATATANSGGRAFEEVLRQVEDGVEMFEFVGTKADGLGFGVEVLPDGTLLETAEVVAVDDLPEVVKDVFAAELPGFEAAQIERNTREGGALIVYELEYERDGETIEAEVHEDGSNFVNLGPSEG